MIMGVIVLALVLVTVTRIKPGWLHLNDPPGPGAKAGTGRDGQDEEGAEADDSG